MDIYVKPSKVSGSLSIPPSKSQTYRAMIFASFAKGTSFIENILQSPDTDYLIDCLTQMGAYIEKRGTSLKIDGNSGFIKNPQKALYVGNSGINFRFLTALCSMSEHPFIINGDQSIQTQRDIYPLLKAIKKLGVQAITSDQSNAPLKILGPWMASKTEVLGHDSQFVSALLIASALSSGKKNIEVLSPGELPWVDLTLSWLEKLNIPFTRKGYQFYTVEGKTISGFNYTVPSDFSSASYPIAAALISKSTLKITGLDFSDLQGDKNFIPLLQRLGINMEVNELNGSLVIFGEQDLLGGTIDINSCIDSLPLLACLGAYGKAPLSIYNGMVARTKECDRISSITNELRKMGAHIEERPDGLKIYPSPLKGACLSSYEDQRMALSLSVAALGASSPSVIQNSRCIEKTYKNFISDFRALGADICDR